MSLKRTADLKQLYSRFDQHKETIVYCRSGARLSTLQDRVNQLEKELVEAEAHK